MNALTGILLTVTYIFTVIWSFSTYGFILGLVVSIVAAPFLSMIATFLIIIVLTIIFSIIGLLIGDDQESPDFDENSIDDKSVWNSSSRNLESITAIIENQKNN